MKIDAIHNALGRGIAPMDVDGCVSVGPVSGSFVALAASELSKKTGILYITAHLDDADEIVAMLQDLGVQVATFPVLETEIAKDILANRFSLLDTMQSDELPDIVVTSVPALMQKTPSPDSVSAIVRRLRVGDECSLSELQEWKVTPSVELLDRVNRPVPATLF